MELGKIILRLIYGLPNHRYEGYKAKASRFNCRIRLNCQFSFAYGIQFHCEQNMSNLSKRIMFSIMQIRK
ncbi:hypothetical protein T09_13104, partial [Trichinella sp. T9]